MKAGQSITDKSNALHSDHKNRIDRLMGLSMRFCHYIIPFGNSSLLTSIGSGTR